MNLKKISMIATAVMGTGLPAVSIEKPNIIHIIADDVSWDDLGCYGAPKIKTPYLDQLAAEGMRFTSFYAPHATCTPSRAAILTGRFAPRINNGAGLEVLFPHSTNGMESDLEICLLLLQSWLVAKFLKIG